MKLTSHSMSQDCYGETNKRVAAEHGVAKRTSVRVLIRLFRNWEVIRRDGLLAIPALFGPQATRSRLLEPREKGFDFFLGWSRETTAQSQHALTLDVAWS